MFTSLSYHLSAPPIHLSSFPLATFFFPFPFILSFQLSFPSYPNSFSPSFTCSFTCIFPLTSVISPVPLQHVLLNVIPSHSLIISPLTYLSYLYPHLPLPSLICYLCLLSIPTSFNSFSPHVYNSPVFLI